MKINNLHPADPNVMRCRTLDKYGFSFGVVFIPSDLATIIHSHCGIRLGDFGGVCDLRCFETFTGEVMVVPEIMSRLN